LETDIVRRQILNTAKCHFGAIDVAGTQVSLADCTPSGGLSWMTPLEFTG
jgi:hypothetical protein